MAVAFIVLEICCILQYVVIGGTDEKNYFLLGLDAGRIDVKFALVIMILMILMAFPVFVEPMRLSMMYFVSIRDDYPLFFWVTVGLIWLLVAAALSAMTVKYQDTALVIAAVIDVAVQFIFPAAMLVKCMPDLPKIHWVGVVLLVVIGLALVLGSLIMTFS
jgi:hypothetical protein